jgi:CRISPR type I-E-associated protein CasB/Cse2
MEAAVSDTATPPPAGQNREHNALIGSLASRLSRHDTQAMSTLRRCLGRLPEVPDARLWPYVIPYVGQNTAAQTSGAVTACLWAYWHTGYTAPVHGTHNLGGALRRALPRDKHQQAYNALATTGWDNLPRHMIGLVKACADARQPLNWDQTQTDMRAWYDGHKDRVLKRWAASLFNPSTVSISAPTAKENA